MASVCSRGDDAQVRPQSVDRYDVVSADGHVLEPEDLWTARVPAKVKERVPRVEWVPHGGAWVIEGVAEPIAYDLNSSFRISPRGGVEIVPLEPISKILWRPPRALRESWTPMQSMEKSCFRTARIKASSATPTLNYTT